MSRNKGKKGETLFRQIMQNNGYIVEDVSGVSDFWDKDIDFIVKSPFSGEVKSFEVKYDYCINRTGNLYLELTNIHSQCGKGWFQFCEADVLAYGDAQTDTFYIIDMQQLRDRVSQHYYTVGSSGGGESTGLLVPLKELEDIIKTI